MCLLLGNTRMESGDYEGAFESFGNAQAQIRHHTGRPLLMISLISGWKFDDLSTTIRQRLCEALYAMGRTKDAVGCFHEMMSESGREATLHGEHMKWVLGEWSCMPCRRLRDIFCQTSRSGPPGSWSISEIQQWMPSSMTRPSPAM
ncbi:hypothetical protein OG21DRAFT_276787 [Imleria badia]|nr:hypothetical protein OG21DRAFT_276787 [Imleria badia]